MRLQTKTRRNRDALIGVLLLGPAILLIGVTILYPMVYGVVLSFFSKQLLRPNSFFVGPENYAFLFSSGRLTESLAHSLVWTLLSVGVSEFLGFWVAYLLNMKLRFRGMFRALMLIPWVIATVVIGYLWLWLANDMYGVLNYVLEWLRIIDRPLAWFSRPDTALLSLTAVNIWRSVPFVAVVLLSGLQSIPGELYEAAKVDGSSRWLEIRYIVLPHLRHVINITLLLMFIWNFNHFDLLWVITEGGPGTSTTTLPLLAYRVGFKSMRLGESAAVATIMFVITFAISLVYMAYLTKLEREEE